MMTTQPRAPSLSVPSAGRSVRHGWAGAGWLTLLAMAGCRTEAPLAAIGEVRIVAGYALPAVGQGMSAFLSLENRGRRADTVVGFASPLAGDVMLHRNEPVNGALIRMVHQSELVLEPGRTVRMKSGALHLMLSQVSAPLAPGDSLPLEVELVGQRRVRVVVPVIAFGDQP